LTDAFSFQSCEGLRNFNHFHATFRDPEVTKRFYFNLGDRGKSRLTNGASQGALSVALAS
jgi:hypothetical protein